MRHLVALVLAGLAGCAFEPGGPGGPADDPGLPDPGIDPELDAGVVTQPPLPPPPRTVACRVDGADLGVVGLQVTSPIGTYGFESWQAASNGDLVGFTLAGPAGVHYEVRTGRTRFWSELMLWTHPELASGLAEPITRVDFCASPDEDGGGGEGGGD